VNGVLAMTSCILAGAGAGFAVVLFGTGHVGEGVLFLLVAAIAAGELVAFVPLPHLVVCGLVVAYSFLASFLLPIGSGSGHEGGHHAGGMHATVR
jgi:hypothetical protein